MDALMNTVAFQAMSMKADAMGQAYSTILTKEAMNMDAQMSLKELEMLPQVPQIPKGQYVDVYA